MPGSQRQQRRQAARRVSKSGRQKRSIAFPLAIVAVLVAGALLIAFTRGDRAEGPAPPEGVETFESLPTDHVEGPVNYEHTPPVGGPHSGIPLTCGFYSQPVPAENAVHSLEHGAIWITFRPNLPGEQVNRLRGLAGPKVLVSPWPERLPAPVVASAWGRQIQLRSADDPRLAQFIRVFRSGSQSPEPFATCEGVGTPE